jgi:hypothetical protein
VRSEDDLIAYIHEAIKSPDGCELKEHEVEEYVTAIEGKFASERILDALDQVSWAEDSLDLAWSNPGAAVLRLHEGWRGIRKGLRSLVKGASDKHLRKQQRTRQKWPGASAGEIELLIDGYREMTGRFKGTEVNEVLPDLFCISKTQGDAHA